MFCFFVNLYRSYIHSFYVPFIMRIEWYTSLVIIYLHVCLTNNTDYYSCKKKEKMEKRNCIYNEVTVTMIKFGFSMTKPCIVIYLLTNIHILNYIMEYKEKWTSDVITWCKRITTIQCDLCVSSDFLDLTNWVI